MHLKEGTRLQLQRRFYQTAPICNLRQIMHIYPNTMRIDATVSGYRHIQLLSNTGNTMPNCTLFVHVAITNKRGGGVSINKLSTSHHPPHPHPPFVCVCVCFFFFFLGGGDTNLIHAYAHTHTYTHTHIHTHAHTQGYKHIYFTCQKSTFSFLSLLFRVLALVQLFLANSCQ
jgi:hypothetical protein